MFWLSRLSADTGYLTGVALPMILIGAGQGAALGPPPAAGIAGVEPRDAGAASGVVDVAHQLGGSLGLGLLVTVFAAANAASLDARRARRDVWARPELSLRDRSLITVASLITGGNTEQLGGHLRRARDNGEQAGSACFAATLTEGQTDPGLRQEPFTDERGGRP